MVLRWIDGLFAAYFGVAGLVTVASWGVSTPPVARIPSLVPAVEGASPLMALQAPSFYEPLAGVGLLIAAVALCTRFRWRHSVAGTSCVASLFLQPALFFMPAVLASGWWLQNLLPPGDRGGFRVLAIITALLASIVGFTIAQVAALRESRQGGGAKRVPNTGSGR